MKKILYIANGGFPNESANRVQIMNMCEAFGENGIDTTLLAHNNKQKNRTHKKIHDYYGVHENFKLILLNTSGNYYARSFILFIHFFFRLRKKHSNIFTRDLFVAFLIKLFFRSKNVIYELHHINENFIRKKLFSITFKKINNLVVISPGLKEYLLRNGFNERKIKILHDGVKIENYAKLHISQNNKIPIILYSGSLGYWKGVDTLLNAFMDIPGEVGILKIIGGKNEEIDRLKNKYNKKNIVFCGRKNPKDIPQLLQDSDILVLPNSGKYKISTSYTSPLKLFEYMASKKPIIASDLPSLRDVLNEESAVFFEADNNKDLKKKLLKLLSDHKKQMKISENAYALVRKFSRKERAKSISRLYK